MSTLAMNAPAMNAPLCAACPVLADAAHLSDLAQDVQRAMRKLRRDLDRCKTCPAGGQCPVLQSYQADIAEAIHVILAEFELIE